MAAADLALKICKAFASGVSSALKPPESSVLLGTGATSMAGIAAVRGVITKKKKKKNKT